MLCYLHYINPNANYLWVAFFYYFILALLAIFKYSTHLIKTFLLFERSLLITTTKDKNLENYSLILSLLTLKLKTFWFSITHFFFFPVSCTHFKTFIFILIFPSQSPYGIIVRFIKRWIMSWCRSMRSFKIFLFQNPIIFWKRDITSV